MGLVFHSGCRPLLFVVLAASLSTAVVGARPPQPAAGDRLAVVGGTARLLKQCHVAGDAQPARAFLLLVRALHGGLAAQNLPAPSPASLFDGQQAAGAGQTDYIPALLPVTVWQKTIFQREIDADHLPAAILGDRRAALLYYGLFSLDDETLAFFASHPLLLASTYRDDAAVFAAFAESITVHDDRVMLPGDEGAAALWEQLVGGPCVEAEAFIHALLGRDEGRLAWLFDTVAHLDGPRQDFVLGRALVDRSRRAQHGRAVYASFAAFQREAVRFTERPFSRSSLDPAVVLSTIAVTPDGKLAPPIDTRTWFAAFGVTAEGSTSREIMLPELLDGLCAAPDRSRLDAILFAQRVLGAAMRGGAAVAGQKGFRPSASELARFVRVVSAFPRFPALLLSLERLGFADPDDYARAIDTATELSSGIDSLPRTLRTANFQATLAVLVRLEEVGSLDRHAAQRLARSLVAVAAPSGAAYSEALAGWIERELVPVLSRGSVSAAADPEGCLLDGLSGSLVARVTPVLQWEDHPYRVDLAGAERARLQRMLDRQRAGSLTAVLEVRRLASAGRAAAAAATLTQLVSQLDLGAGARIFGETVPPIREEAVTDDGDSARVRAVRQRVAQALDVVMADVLAAHVYAIAIEDPDSPVLLLDRPARRHRFAGPSRRINPWMLAMAVHVESGSAVTGSLLGLERAIAVLALRRPTLDVPPRAPTLGQPVVQGFAESAAALDAFRLTDASRDEIAAALKRGRERLAAAEHDPAAVDALIASVGVERWRRRLIRWTAANDPAVVPGCLSLSEILALGSSGKPSDAAEAWGIAQRPVDGSLQVRLPASLAWHVMAGRLSTGLVAARVPDLTLRIAEGLAAMNLPAALAHDVLQYATWDLTATVQSADIDDWLAIIERAQALSADQMADYVSALTADGPLVPVK